MKDRPKTKKQRKMFGQAQAADVAHRAAAVTAGNGVAGSADRLGTPGVTRESFGSVDRGYHRFVG